MAEAKVEKKQASKAKFYKISRHAGTRFLVKSDENDPTLNEYVAFKPVREKYQGDTRMVGYLKTDDPKLQAKVEKTAYVSEVKESEYNQVFGLK